jgi:hypothetical protein
MSLAGQPLNASGTGPHRSRADYWWCRLAVQWGWSVEEVTERLKEVSDKTRATGAKPPLGSSGGSIMARDSRRERSHLP